MGALSDAGLNIDVSGIDWAGGAMTVLSWTAVTVIAIIVIVWLVLSARDKKIYVHRVTLISRRSNGNKTRMDLRGGVVKGRSGVIQYKIKIPKVWRKKVLGYMPDLSLATADDRLVFIQEGDGTIWQQCKETLITEKEVVEPALEPVMVPVLDKDGKQKTNSLGKKLVKKALDKEGNPVMKPVLNEDGTQKMVKVGTFSLLIEPIPTDVKTVTYNNMQNVRELIDKNKLTAFGITIVGFIIMVIAHLISLYVQTKIKCPIP